MILTRIKIVQQNWHRIKIVQQNWQKINYMNIFLLLSTEWDNKNEQEDNFC